MFVECFLNNQGILRVLNNNILWMKQSNYYKFTIKLSNGDYDLMAKGVNL